MTKKGHERYNTWKYRRMPDDERIDSFVRKDPGGCWIWTGPITSAGYGNTNFNKKTVTTHRYMYERHKGPIPKGMVVCHSCDVTACCNPDHLWIGTHAENMRDMDSKGRRRRKVNDEIAAKIRAEFVAGKSAKTLAAEFSLGLSTIKNIVHRKTWEQTGIDGQCSQKATD